MQINYKNYFKREKGNQSKCEIISSSEKIIGKNYFHTKPNYFTFTQAYESLKFKDLV